MRGRRLIAAIAACLALVAVSCGGADDPTVPVPPGGEGGGGTIDIGGERANDHGKASVAGDASVELELDDNYFEPTVLDGEAGQTLTIEAFNEGDAPHTFTIEGTDIDEVLQPGDRTEIEVTFPESGAIVFHCHFHDSIGMRGALSVGGSLEVAERGGGQGGDDDAGSEEDEGAAEDDGEGKY